MTNLHKLLLRSPYRGEKFPPRATLRGTNPCRARLGWDIGMTESILRPGLQRQLRWIIVGLVLLHLGKTILFSSVGQPPLVGDAVHYWGCAQRVASGDWLMVKDRPEILRTPGYPWFLALLQLGFGRFAMAAAVVCQQAMIFATAMITAGMCQRLTRSSLGAVIGLGLAACCISQNSIALHIFSEPLFTLLLTSSRGAAGRLAGSAGFARRGGGRTAAGSGGTGATHCPVGMRSRIADDGLAALAFEELASAGKPLRLLRGDAGRFVDSLVCTQFYLLRETVFHQDRRLDHVGFHVPGRSGGSIESWPWLCRHAGNAAVERTGRR